MNAQRLRPNFVGVVEITRTCNEDTGYGPTWTTEFRIVESSMPSAHPVGQSCVWRQSRQNREIALGALKEFLTAVGIPPPEMDATLNAAAEAPGTNTLIGRRVRVQTHEVKTQSGHDFVVHNWAPSAGQQRPTAAPQGGPEAAPALDRLTILRCKPPLVATKRVRVVDGALQILTGSDKAKYFSFSEEPVNSIYELSELLSRTALDPRALVIRGAPLPGILSSPDNFVRRLSHARDGDPPSFGPEPRRWVAFDFDRIELPEEVDLVANPEHAIQLLLRQCLPPPFWDVSCHWTLSSSAVPRTRVLSARPWFWLNRPVGDDEWRAWAKANNVPACVAALFEPVQAHYTAAPIFEGSPDWIPRRFGGMQGSRDQVDLPVTPFAEDPAQPDSGPRRAETQIATARAVAHVALMPPHTPGSNRMWNVAMALGRGFELSEATTLQILREHYNPRCLPPWADELLKHKAREAVTATGKLESGYLLKCPCKGCSSVAPPAFDLIDADEIFLSPLPPIKHIVPDLDIAPGAPASISGFGFGGKTTAAQDFAIEVASFDIPRPGEPSSELADMVRSRLLWGLFPVTRGGPVLHLDYEVGSHLTKLKYRRLLRARGIDPHLMRGRLRVSVHPKAYLDDPPKVEEELVRLCTGVVLCIVDSLRASAPALEENNSEMRAVQDMLGRVSERTDCAFVVLTHGRKPGENGQGNSTYAVRGSSAIFDAASCQLFISGEEPNAPRKVEHRKAKNTGITVEDFEIVIEDVEIGGDPRAGLRVTARRAGTGGSHDGRPVGWDDTKSERHARIIEYIARVGEVRSKNTIIEALGGNRKAMNAGPDLLEGEGIVQRRGNRLSLSDEAVRKIEQTKARMVDMLTKTKDREAHKRELGQSFIGLDQIIPFNGRAPYSDLRRWLAKDGDDIYVLAACAAAVKEGVLVEHTQHLPERWTGVVLKGWVPYTMPRPDQQPPCGSAGKDPAGPEPEPSEAAKSPDSAATEPATPAPPEKKKPAKEPKGAS